MTTNKIKIIALVAMLLDHAASSFPSVFPAWFGWIGRLAIPLFLFAVTEGISHTSNTKKYLARIYLFSIVVAIGNFALNSLFPNSGHAIADNIFTTIFSIAFTIALIRYKGTTKRKVQIWVGYLALQAVGVIIAMMFPAVSPITAAVIPTWITCEGSVLFVILGLMLYSLSPARQSKKRLIFSVAYVIYCALLFIISVASGGFTFNNLFVQNYLWLMIIALPFILAYNGKKGRGMKYMFYVFYPAHLWIFYILSNLRAW